MYPMFNPYRLRIYLIFGIVKTVDTFLEEIVDVLGEFSQVIFAKAIAIPAHGLNDF
jgi:hypothetical protein